MRIVFFILISVITISAQWNLYYQTVAVDSLEDSIMVDLGIDAAVIKSRYGSTEEETRAIGIILDGTWTNDSLQVLASMTDGGTYYPVYYDEALLYLVATTGDCWIALKPQHFAGIRFLCLKPVAAETDDRTMYIIRRQY